MLLAQSVTHDGDRVWGDADRERLAALEPMLALDERPLRPLLAMVGGREMLDAPLAPALYLWPWLELAGVAGARLGQALLLALAALVAARALGARVGVTAPWWVLLLLFGSTAGLAALHLWPDAFLLALAALGLALALWERPTVAEVGELPEVWQDVAERRGRGLLPRLAAAGLLLGLLGGSAPWTLPLVGAAAAQVPRERRRGGLVALLLPALLVIGALVWWQAATTPHRGGSALADWALSDWALGGLPVAGPDGEAPALFAGTRLAPSLWGWNTLYLVAGRHVGLLFACAPLLALFACASLRGGRRALLLAVVLACGLLLWLHPFTFSGLPWAVGSTGFLPLFPALWFLADGSPRRPVLAAVWLWAAAFLWPLWVHPWTVTAAPREQPRLARPYLRWLPVETSQVHLDEAVRVRSGSLRILPLTAAVVPAAGPGRLRFFGRDPVDLLVASPHPLQAVDVVVAGDAGADLTVHGGKLAETMLRPDGGVEFLVRFDRARAEHPMPWSADGAWFYRLGLELPKAAPRPLVLRVAGVTELAD